MYTVREPTLFLFLSASGVHRRGSSPKHSVSPLLLTIRAGHYAKRERFARSLLHHLLLSCFSRRAGMASTIFQICFVIHPEIMFTVLPADNETKNTGMVTKRKISGYFSGVCHWGTFP